MGELTTRVGRPVRFGAPRDVKKAGGGGKRGVISDEVWATPEINKALRHGACERKGCWGDYSFCAQLIGWDDGDYSIRLAYYRRRCGENGWEYASQMTVNSDWSTIKKLLERTLLKRSWFRDNPESPEG